MKFFAVAIVLLVNSGQVSPYGKSSFHDLVCQQCNSWCMADQSALSSPLRGKAGPRGPPGARGDTGQKGSQGDRGLDGIDGLPGAPGPVGTKGRHGDRGLVGAPGPSGQKGSKGDRGLTGVDGRTGPPGTPGQINMTAIEEKINRSIDEFSKALFPRDCKSVRPDLAMISNRTGGVFDIYPQNIDTLSLYCDFTTDGGGWTVFQRRMDGSVVFNRGWNDYVNGFGEKQGEFWLGLENIYQMTKDGDHELRVDMMDVDGNRLYWKYSSFSIGDASTNYRLSVSGYSGNDYNRLRHHDNITFTTKDADHDQSSSGNCAEWNKGGWWYNYCFYANLNGVYGIYDYKGICLCCDGNPNKYLNFVEMKYRRKN